MHQNIPAMDHPSSLHLVQHQFLLRRILRRLQLALVFLQPYQLLHLRLVLAQVQRQVLLQVQANLLPAVLIPAAHLRRIQLTLRTTPHLYQPLHPRLILAQVQHQVLLRFQAKLPLIAFIPAANLRRLQPAVNILQLHRLLAELGHPVLEAVLRPLNLPLQ